MKRKFEPQRRRGAEEDEFMIELVLILSVSRRLRGEKRFLP